MKKRRSSIVISLAVLFFATLGLNTWLYTSTARTIPDKTIIEHTQLEFFVPGKRILMQAHVSDPAGIAEARLYFGTSKDTKNLVYSKMNPQGDSYVGIIPSPSSKTEKIFYSFLSVNYNGDVVKTALFELRSSVNVGFVPTWQGDFNEYGETLILSKEGTSTPLSTVIASGAKQSHGLEGFADSIIVNAAKPSERYFASKKVQRIPGLSTTDGGDVEPEEEGGEVKRKGFTKKQKIIGGGVLGVGAVTGIVLAISGGGGGGDGGTTTTTTTTSTTITGTTPPTTLPSGDISAEEGITGGIDFDPTSGQLGDPVSVSIIFNNLPAFASGDQMEIRIGTDSRFFSPCDGFGGQWNCDFGPILKFSSTDNNIRFFVNLELQGRVKVFGPIDLPLEFN
jgi:hypothetical protein